MCCSARLGEMKEVKSEPSKERSSTVLRFASFPARLWGRGGLSRVEMNALRAPLTALPSPQEKCLFFLLDRADAFIDGQLSPTVEALSRGCSNRNAEYDHFYG